jgi:hypothetical protein
MSELDIGRRIHVIGNSCSGKSTLGEQLAAALQVPFVELDALNWQPNWVGLNETDPEELERLLRQATKGDGWVVAGSYASFSQRVFWPHLKVWNKEKSLVWWIVTQHRRKRDNMRAYMSDPRWQHIKFLHLASSS